MTRLSLLVAVMVFLSVGAAFTFPLTIPRYQVQSISIGDDLDKVFGAFGPPQAIQAMGKDDGGALQLLYFRGEDAAIITLSDLPENKVTQIEFTGNAWTTDSPVKVGDRMDKVITKIGKPDQEEDLTAQKSWMLEQSDGNAAMRRLIERNSGDTGSWYRQLGLYMEYDKNSFTVKSIRIYDPLSELSVNVGQL